MIVSLELHRWVLLYALQTLRLLRCTTVNWLGRLTLASMATLVLAAVSDAGDCVPCGGCSDPCANVATGSGCGVAGCGPATVAACPGVGHAVCDEVCEPTTIYRLIMEPKYVTETRAVCVTENRTEKRYRTKTIYNTVPVTEECYRSKVVNVPKTETKTITYTVLVPEKTEKTVELTESVPEWTEVPEEYTVRVPQIIEVPETYTVKVAQLQDQEFTYTVNVPYPVTEQKMLTVVNAVPVTKTRTVEVCVPQTTMKQVCKDYGHWEEQVVDVASVATSSCCGASAGCGVAKGCASRGCGHHGRHGRLFHRGGGCGSGCGVVNNGCGSAGVGCSAPVASVPCGAPMTKKVWVPNVQTEMVPVTTASTRTDVISYTVYEQHATQVPYDCTKVCYRPETRTGTKKVCVYVDEERTRMRRVVKYNDEKRTRMRKELTYKTVTKTETVPHISYRTEERTKEVSYTVNVPEYTMEPYTVTRYDRVAEEQVEEYTVCVPVVVTKEQTVQVCRMVPRLVEETVNLCCQPAACQAVSTGCGCGQTVSAPAACSGCGAPAASPCGC